MTNSALMNFEIRRLAVQANAELQRKNARSQILELGIINDVLRNWCILNAGIVIPPYPIA